MEELVIDFYKEIYQSNIVESNGIIGFKNNIFNNPIMTPNFIIENDINEKVISDHHKKLENEAYWLNIFANKRIKPKRSFLKGLHLQYVLNSKKFHNPLGYKYRFEIVGHLFGKTKADFMQMTNKNSFGLDLVTQEKITKVVQSSKANIEYLIVYSGAELIGGFTILHGKDYSLFINGSINKEHREQGVFKKMLATGVNHGLEQGKLGCFYWTLNEKLKNKGNALAELDIVNFSTPM